jgi:hypothetical protein
MTYVERRNGTLTTIDEIGEIIGLEQAKQGGCHATISVTQFYRPNVSLPPTISDCNDNIGMVEFGGAIRFYYLFHSPLYENKALVHIYRNIFGIPRNSELDVFVWNTDGRKKPVERPNRKINFEMLGALKGIQQRDLGLYFGENNPWVYDPPGYHPCMPGVPDDEVNLLLFWLLVGGSST